MTTISPFFNHPGARAHRFGALAARYAHRVGRYALTACVAAVLGGVGGPAMADAGRAASQIFVCQGAGGVPEYRNGPAGRGCKPLDLQGVVSVPAGRNTPRAPARVDREPATIASFPRVDRAVQRQRDGERRAVLQEELRSEEARLATLRAEYNQGQPERRGDERNHQRYLERVDRLGADIARSEANAAALRRELANLKE